MILLELYWSFLKIGVTSFGGLSMIPLISSEMLSHGWMTAGEVSDIIAIAEMTPGPLGLNCASFAGIRTAGLFGAFFANLGILTPTLTLCAIVAAFFEHFKNSRRLEHMMTGVRPACVGLVAGVMTSLIPENYILNGAVSVPAVCLGTFSLILLLKFRVSIPKVIGISAALGVLLFGIMEL